MTTEFLFPTQTTSKKRIQLGQGTSFIQGKKDPSVAHLIDQILEHGYVILPRLYTPEQVALALSEQARIEELDHAGPAAKGGRNPFEGYDTRRIYALPDKSRAFDCFPIHPTVLALNNYFLEPNYLLNSYHTVAIGSGETPQTIHTDDGLVSLPRPRPLMGAGTMIALDDFTPENGATLLIPGSHLWGDDRTPTREEMIPAVMPAGSMLYFLNTVFHSGGANVTGKDRNGITLQYCQPWMRPYENMTIGVGWEDLDQIPKPLLALMGFSTHEFRGSVDGRSPRAGVELTKKKLIEWGVKKLEKEKEKEKGKQSKL